MPSNPGHDKNPFERAKRRHNPQPWTIAEVAAKLAGKFPHYRVRELLGAGGMGAVYLVDDTRRPVGDQAVALKFLRWDQWGRLDDAPEVRFWHEPGFLQSLDHPLIVKALDDGATHETAEGIPFFAMPYVAGTNLGDRVAQAGKLPLAEAQAIFEDIGDALQHAHQRGLVHRDVKAHNAIVRAADGRTMLFDFGIARQAAAAPSTLSQQGIPGTPGHIAPEVKSGGVATAASDQFGLAVIAYQMLTGLLPDVGFSKVSLSRGPDPDPRFAEMDEVLARALSQDPAGRFPSVAAFVAAFRQGAVAVSSPRASGAPPPMPAAPRVVMKSPSDVSAGPRELAYADAPALSLHRNYLAGWAASHPRPVIRSVPVESRAERWEVVDQWNAFPAMPTIEEVDARIRRRRTVGRIGGRFALGVGSAFTILYAVAMVYLWTLGETPKDNDWTPVVAALPFCLFLTFLFWIPCRFIPPMLYRHFTKSGVMNWRENDEHYWEQDGRDLTDPKTLWWHPTGPYPHLETATESYLYVAKDHKVLRVYAGHLRASGDHHHRGDDDRVPVFSRGLIEEVLSQDTRMLVRSKPRWFGSLPEHWIAYGSYDGSILADAEGNFLSDFFGWEKVETVKGNPLRPDNDHRASSGVVAFNRAGRADMISLRNLSARPTSSKVDETLSLKTLLISDQEVVDSFAWHPSGNYLAVSINGRLTILHWDNALVIAHIDHTAQQFPYEAAGWSPDGALLAVDLAMTKVFDIRTFTMRDCQPHERWTNRNRGELELRRTSADGLRQWHNAEDWAAPDVAFQLRGARDFAWHPTDPELFATVGGPGCERDIRVWRRKNS